MKIMKCLLVAGVITILCAVPHSVMAQGLGVAVTGAWGNLTTDDSFFFDNYYERTRFDQDRFAVGMVYDTNVARDALFNYRMTLSYQKMKANTGDRDKDLDGFAVENDFGFGVYRAEQLRLWVGPEVRVEYLEGDRIDAGYRTYENSFAIGFGPVAGLNIPLNNDLSLALRGGYVFQTGVRFSEWGERFGFASIGLLLRMGE